MKPLVISHEISLIEHQSQTFNHDFFSPEIESILDHHLAKNAINLEPPTYKNQYHWKLTAKGQIGVFNITTGTTAYTIRIKPKTGIAHIWRMLDYVESAKNIKIFAGLVACDRLEDTCDLLAQKLADGILLRIRQGLIGRYQPQHQLLTTVRGRIDWSKAVGSPGQAALPCIYSHYTVDIPDNQILLWTAHQLIRLRYNLKLKDTTYAKLIQADRALRGMISYQMFNAQDCCDRHYDRLNQDYEVLHALCRFFLEATSAGYQHGNQQSLPFLIDVDKLYEKCVAAAIRRKLPPQQFVLQAQESHSFAQHYKYQIDLVLYKRFPDTQEQAIAVLDTKYKVPDKSANADINQIIAYAHFKTAKYAILIYPEPLVKPINYEMNGIRIQTLTFSLNGDLDQAGENIVRQLEDIWTASQIV